MFGFLVPFKADCLMKVHEAVWVYKNALTAGGVTVRDHAGIILRKSHVILHIMGYIWGYTGVREKKLKLLQWVL